MEFELFDVICNLLTQSRNRYKVEFINNNINYFSCHKMGAGKPRGIRAGRKLKTTRRLQKYFL